jgi:hypothetical protein
MTTLIMAFILIEIVAILAGFVSAMQNDEIFHIILGIFWFIWIPSLLAKDRKRSWKF